MFNFRFFICLICFFFFSLEISERKRLLELRNRSDLSKTDKLALAFGSTQPSLASSLIKGRSETDLKALTSYFDPFDPNSTNVSSLLNTQSNDFTFLNSRSSYNLINDDHKTENANNQYTSLSGLNNAEFKNTKKLDSYLSDSYLNENYLKDSSYSIGLPKATRTTTTFINSPMNLSNLNSTFSDCYFRNRLDANLPNRLDLNLKETKIQDTNNSNYARLGRASTSLSQSYGGPLRSNLKYSKRHDKWRNFDHQDLDNELKTTRFSDLDSRQLNSSLNQNQSAFNSFQVQSTAFENQDGKLFNEFDLIINVFFY